MTIEPPTGHQCCNAAFTARIVPMMFTSIVCRNSASVPSLPWYGEFHSAIGVGSKTPALQTNPSNGRPNFDTEAAIAASISAWLTTSALNPAAAPAPSSATARCNQATSIAASATLKCVQRQTHEGAAAADAVPEHRMKHAPPHRSPRLRSR